MALFLSEPQHYNTYVFADANDAQGWYRPADGAEWTLPLPPAYATPATSLCSPNPTRFFPGSKLGLIVILSLKSAKLARRARCTDGATFGLYSIFFRVPNCT